MAAAAATVVAAVAGESWGPPSLNTLCLQSCRPLVLPRTLNNDSPNDTVCTLNQPTNSLRQDRPHFLRTCAVLSRQICLRHIYYFAHHCPCSYGGGGGGRGGACYECGQPGHIARDCPSRGGGGGGGYGGAPVFTIFWQALSSSIPLSSAAFGLYGESLSCCVSNILSCVTSIIFLLFSYLMTVFLAGGGYGALPGILYCSAGQSCALAMNDECAHGFGVVNYWLWMMSLRLGLSRWLRMHVACRRRPGWLWRPGWWRLPAGWWRVSAAVTLPLDLHVWLAYSGGFASQFFPILSVCEAWIVTFEL